MISVYDNAKIASTTVFSITAEGWEAKMKNVQYQIGSNAVMLTADISGRWGLSCPAAIEIVNGVCSVGLATPKKTLTSDNWNLISVKKGNRRDEYGLLDTIAMEFSAPESLIIVWEGGVYAERGVVVCQMTIKNIGSHDLFVDSLSPFFARSEKGSVLYLNGSPDGVVRALHNNMWMGGNLRPVYIPDDRGMQKDYHVTALSRESGGCLVAGMGERANTVPLFGWARRGHGFEFMAGGLTMVNRRYTPLRIRPGTGFTMNRLTLVPGVDPYACFETYGDYLATYTHTNLDKKPYTGIFCGYGQDVLERKDWFHYPLTVDRIKELMEITDKYLAPYGIDYIKTQFGGLSSGPAGMVFEKRDWSDAPVFPEANSPEELAAIIEEKSFTPDTYNLKDYMPDGVAALSREVHGRGYRHALVCRPFLNVEAGSAKLDRYAAEVFGMCSDKWGYDYLMFDFISADFENDLDDTVTMAQSISNRFQAVRERVGKHIFIEACMSMPGPVIGIVDGYRPACDWRGGLEPDIAGELLSYYYLHGKIFQMDLEFFDPDVSPMIWEGFGPENGTRPLHGSLDRVKQWVSFSGLTGYSYLTGGVIDRVSPERWRIFSRAMPIYGKAARPLDLMSADRVSLLVLEAQDCVH